MQIRLCKLLIIYVHLGTIVVHLMNFPLPNVRHCFERLQQPYQGWNHFHQRSKKTWLMSTLSLAMQLRHSHNHSQEDVLVDIYSNARSSNFVGPFA